MPDINGIHGPEDGHTDNIDACLEMAGPNGSITILNTIIRLYPYIRQKYPGIFICLRFYHPDWTALAPRDWADQNFAQMQQYPGMVHDPNLSVFGYNEMDLSCESGGKYGANAGRNSVPIEEYRLIFNTQYDYIDRMQTRKAQSGGRFPVGCLAGADGHEPPNTPPDWQYTMPECKRVVDRADIIWGHAYTEPGHGANPTDDIHMWKALRPLRPARYREERQGLPLVGGIPDPGGFHAQYPNKPYILTEGGNGAHGDTARTALTFAQHQMMYREYAKQGCRGIDWFIFNAGSNHGMARFAGNWPLIDLHRHMERIAVTYPPPIDPFPDEPPDPEPPGGGDTLTRNEAWLLDMWKRLGVPNVNRTSAEWRWILAQADAGNVYTPMPSPDGNWQNWNADSEYVLCYTLPKPLYFKRGEWVIRPGLPPF